MDWDQAATTGSATLVALGVDDGVLGEAHVRVEGGHRPVVFLDNIRSWSRGAASAIVGEIGQQFPDHALQGGALEVHDDDGLAWMGHRVAKSARFPHERPCLGGESCECPKRILEEVAKRDLEDHSPGLSTRSRPSANDYRGLRRRSPI